MMRLTPGRVWFLVAVPVLVGVMAMSAAASRPVQQAWLPQQRGTLIPQVTTTEMVTPTPSVTPHPLMTPCYGPAGEMKCWSGVHLGNKTYTDWVPESLWYIDPEHGGKWPAAITVLSSSIYGVERELPPTPGADCHITGVTRKTNLTQVWDYLLRARDARVPIIIRIWPSPGNFEDWNQWPPSTNHNILQSQIVDDCHWGNEYYEEIKRFKGKRSRYDVGTEMLLIWDDFRNPDTGVSVYGFEPFNEPNTEWYQQNESDPSRPRVFEYEAWRDIDFYFQWIYDWVKAIEPNIHVLAPPQAPFAYAEKVNVQGCSAMAIREWPGLTPTPWPSGYDGALFTYERGETDGYSWHGYWKVGTEAYEPCPQQPGGSWGWHVSNYFPASMTAFIESKNRNVITESDLHSASEPNKQFKLDYPNETAESVRAFFYQEWRHWDSLDTDVKIVSWLLVDDTHNLEYQFHLAYDEPPPLNYYYYPRDWFHLWYTGSEHP